MRAVWLRVCAGLVFCCGVASTHAGDSAPVAACQAAAVSVGLPVGADAVVVVLSPRMVYALIEWPRMREAAVAMGLRVVASRAPGLPEQEWAAAVEAAGQPELRSLPTPSSTLTSRC